MGKTLLSASILSSDFGNLRAVVKELGEAGLDSIHLDIMDGGFVPRITFGSQMVASIRPATTIPFEVHLMVNSPERHIESFAQAGAQALIMHYEASKDKAMETLKDIKSSGMRAGIAMDLGSGFESVKKFIEYADILLVMGVKAGLGGQAFVPESLKKVEAARDYISKNGYGTIIEVDGGINLDNCRSIVSAGADELIIGTAITGSNSMENVKKFKNLLGS